MFVYDFINLSCWICLDFCTAYNFRGEILLSIYPKVYLKIKCVFGASRWSPRGDRSVFVFLGFQIGYRFGVVVASLDVIIAEHINIINCAMRQGRAVCHSLSFSFTHKRRTSFILVKRTSCGTASCRKIILKLYGNTKTIVFSFRKSHWFFFTRNIKNYFLLTYWNNIGIVEIVKILLSSFRRYRVLSNSRLTQFVYPYIR